MADQDWFQANAPSQAVPAAPHQAGGDWFQTNAPSQPQLSPADQALAKVGITLSGASGPGKAPIPFGLEKPAADQPTQPGLLDPHQESGMGSRLVEFVRGAAAIPGKIIAHPVDTFMGMGQSPTLSGMSVGGQYPSFAMTGDPVRDMANLELRQKAQGAAVDQGRDLVLNHPAYLAGNVAGAYLTGKAISAAPGAVDYFRDTPHPRAASNLAAAADVGGKPGGVSAVYEDYAKPAADAYRNAAAREGVTPQDFKGRAGYDTAIQVADRLQQEANVQFQPYRQLVDNHPIPDAMSTRIKTQLGPIMDALPGKLSQAISDAKTVGDLDNIRMELNKGGGRFFNASTDTQFSAPESQQAMANAGNVLRDEVYSHIEDVTGHDVRPIKQLEGNAINLRNQFEKAKPKLSKVADEADAPPGLWQHIRSGKTVLETGKSLLNPLTKQIGLNIEPPNQLDIFNKRMQRAVRGGNASPLPPPGIQVPGNVSMFTTPRALPENVPGYNTPVAGSTPFAPPGYQLGPAPPPTFPQTEIQGQPYIPRANAPLKLPPASSIQVGGTTPRLSLREQLQAAGRRR